MGTILYFILMRTSKHIPSRAIRVAVETVLHTGCRKATVFVDEGTVVTCTARFRPDNRRNMSDYVLTIGSPNFAGRRFVRLCKKAGVKLPVKPQLKWWPDKKKGKVK